MEGFTGAALTVVVIILHFVAASINVRSDVVLCGVAKLAIPIADVTADTVVMVIVVACVIGAVAVVVG